MVNDDQIRRFMQESGWENLNHEELTDAVSNELERLVKQGLIEQLVGEDGKFYYRSAKKSKICEIKESPIHGYGLFASCDIKAGTTLFETHTKNPNYREHKNRKDFEWVDLQSLSPEWVNMKPNCSYNHSSSDPNCMSRTTEKTKLLVAIKDIKTGEELLVDYRQDKDLQQPEQEWN